MREGEAMQNADNDCFLCCCFSFFVSGGKQRTKVEVQLNSQHHDAGGDTRKIVQAMANNEKNQKHEKK